MISARCLSQYIPGYHTVISTASLTPCGHWWETVGIPASLPRDDYIFCLKGAIVQYRALLVPQTDNGEKAHLPDDNAIFTAGESAHRRLSHRLISQIVVRVPSWESNQSA